MNKWTLYLLSFLVVSDSSSNNSKSLNDNLNIIELSQQLLLAAKMREPTETAVRLLARMPAAELQQQLSTDDKKKAFWINVYNAYTQVILLANSEKYKGRNDFFRSKQVIIAGKNLSLDDIEHGLLRRSSIKWSLGYLNKVYSSRFEKLNRVEQPDYRIHFAINCGAKSCPPIAFYKPDKMDDQLNLAMKAYLKSETNYDPEKNIVSLPAIMSWFRGDFGGKKAIKELLKKLSIIPANKNPSIRFNKYDWNLFLENYKHE